METDGHVFNKIKLDNNKISYQSEIIELLHLYDCWLKMGGCLGTHTSHILASYTQGTLT